MASEAFSVINPTSGEAWWAKAFFPEDASADNPYPAVVVVQGGNGAGSTIENVGGINVSPVEQAARGFVVVIFDADGRGNTGGEEDYCGHTHQDGLAALVEEVASFSYVDADRIGVQTRSYGVTMGSGLLARYPELPLRFLVDSEGPANRDDTGHCDAFNTGHINHDCDDDVWWSEREADNFLTQLEVPYIRLQHTTDHAQPDNDHCILMINSATSDAYGGGGVSSWTRVNRMQDNQANMTYSQNSPPTYMDDAEVFDLPSYWEEAFNL